MITREDVNTVSKIFEKSGLWETIINVKELSDINRVDSDTRYDNIIEVEMGKRTSVSGGTECQMSIEVTIPLMKEQMIVVFCSDTHAWVKKIKPILRWDLVEG